MTTSTIRHSSAPLQGARPRTRLASLHPTSAPWPLYAALGLFLFGIAFRVCSVALVG